MMRKFALIIFTILGLSIHSYAQTINQEELIAKVNKAAGDIKSLECEFTQTKHISLLKDKMQSNGKMYYNNSSKLRWEYLSPYKYCFILNDTKVSLASSTKKDVIDIKNNQMFQEIVKIMMNSVTGKCLSSSSDFRVNVTVDGNRTIAVLYPKKKNLRQLFSNITLRFNADYSMIETVELYEKSGDKTEIKLKNPKLNGEIDESVFAID